MKFDVEIVDIVLIPANNVLRTTIFFDLDLIKSTFLYFYLSNTVFSFDATVHLLVPCHISVMRAVPIRY